MTKELVLILGGARSGKSALAQRLATASGGRVLFIATAEAGDDEMRRRIAHHRASRPADWTTLEVPRDLARAVAASNDYDVAIVDCLGVWVSNLLADADPSSADAEAAILEAASQLLAAYEAAAASLILVSQEVGMGLVPPYPLGRAFRDVLGRVNQRLAARADRVYLTVSGLALEMKSLGATTVAGDPSEEGASP